MTFAESHYYVLASIPAHSADVLIIANQECNSIRYFYPWLPFPVLFLSEPSQFFLLTGMDRARPKGIKRIQ